MKSTDEPSQFPRVGPHARVPPLVFLLAAIVLLVSEHRAHLLGLIPYALLALCVLMHVFHGGHAQHGPRSRGAGHVHGDTKP